MRIDVLTLFPEFIAQAAEVGVVGRAQERALLSVHGWNPRDYASGNYRRVDERPFGGGPGMVMLMEPLSACLDAALAADPAPARVLYTSPQGVPLTQAKARELAAAVLIDAVGRLQEGALNDADSALQDSFEDGLLDCPHYTRSESRGTAGVPPVLLSGDHAAIRRWRRQQSLGRTWLRRPELLDRLSLDKTDRALLEAFQAEWRAGAAGKAENP